MRPTDNSQRESYDTESWNVMNKLVKTKIDLMPGLAICVYPSAHVFARMCVSAVFWNQLELSLSLLLIFQPIVMKHCWEEISNSLPCTGLLVAL